MAASAEDAIVSYRKAGIDREGSLNLELSAFLMLCVLAGSLLACSLVEAAAPIEQTIRFAPDRADYLKQYEAVFLRPITEGGSAVPVGNGDLAAVAWQPDHLTWMLNKCDIGGTSQAARLVIETPQKISERIGRLETRLSLADATATIRYQGGLLPQDAGWVWRGVNGPLPVVKDTDQGTVAVRFYVPNGRNVFLLSYNEEAKVPHPITVAFERWVQEEFGKQVKAQVRDNTLAITYTLDHEGYAASYAAVLAFDGFAGATLAQPSPLRATLNIPASPKVSGRIAVAVVTSLEAADPLEAATKLAVSTLQEPEEAILAQHRQYWTAFWDRLFVDSGHPYLNALYHMSLYELGITSRGKRPVKFNGALNLWSEKYRTWGSGYWCHNQSETYLQTYAANQIELSDNFHAWIAGVRPEAVKAARKNFQIDGAYYPEVMSWDYTVQDPEIPAKPDGMGYILSSGTRYALMMWNRYQYTLDRQFLAEKAYPVIRDCAAFYVNYAKLGEDGKYHVAPSMSWEEPPLGRDAHADCAAMRAIFPIAIQVATLLKMDADKIPIWRDRLAKVPDYPVSDGVFSVVMRDDGTPEPTDHYQWQLPNLSGVFPYSVIGIGSTPELKAIADDTFNRYRFNADAGHEFLPVIAARLGNAEWWRAAMFQYIDYFQIYDQGLLHYYNIYSFKETGQGINQGHHPYLEASGILATAVNEMLLQSYDGIIRVFPAAPEHWTSRFILRAAGSYLVASEHRGKAGILYIAIQPVGGEPRACRVAIPWAAGADLLEGGRRRPLKTEQGVAAFDTRPGAVYVLLPKGAKLEDIPPVKEDFKGYISPCHLGNSWYGNTDGPNAHTPMPLW